MAVRWRRAFRLPVRDLHPRHRQRRSQAIEQYAQVVRTAGNYDDSVRRAAEDAARFGRHVVSDTSYPGYMEVPKDVMGLCGDGRRSAAPMPRGRRAADACLPAGAWAAWRPRYAHFWEQLGERRPRFIVVEPDKAACLYESARAGVPVAVHGDLDTVMGPGLRRSLVVGMGSAASGRAGFPDGRRRAALQTVRLLASGRYGEAVVAGESAVAG